MYGEEILEILEICSTRYRDKLYSYSNVELVPAVSADVPSVVDVSPSDTIISQNFLSLRRFFVDFRCGSAGKNT